MSAEHTGQSPCPCRGCVTAYKAGLAAARDAVATLPVILYNNAVYDTDPPDVRHAVDLDCALAAIDALRGDA